MAWPVAAIGRKSATKRAGADAVGAEVRIWWVSGRRCERKNSTEVGTMPLGCGSWATGGLVGLGGLVGGLATRVRHA
jgi:hypothetical protein